jgi:CHAD domain-containing protein
MGEDDGAPAGRMAAKTLRRRLDAVWSELRLACESSSDVEHVHRLRVATRRALAAFDAFHPLLPAKQRAWFEKRLRRLRRAAGEARDLDVLTDRLATSAASRARSRLVAMLSKQRTKSRAPIREQRERLLEDDWQGRVARLLDRVHGRERQLAFGVFARRRFKPMIKSFFARADRKLRDANEIHELRIEGKKLRYALEIFATVFPPRVRSRCQESLEQLQETLGGFTDHAAAADRFARWARSPDAGANRELLTELCRDENTHADKARKVFSSWWKPSRRRTLRRRFERTLRRHSA